MTKIKLSSQHLFAVATGFDICIYVYVIDLNHVSYIEMNANENEAVGDRQWHALYEGPPRSYNYQNSQLSKLFYEGFVNWMSF